MTFEYNYIFRFICFVVLSYQHKWCKFVCIFIIWFVIVKNIWIKWMHDKLYTKLAYINKIINTSNFSVSLLNLWSQLTSKHCIVTPCICIAFCEVRMKARKGMIKICTPLDSWLMHIWGQELNSKDIMKFQHLFLCSKPKMCPFSHVMNELDLTPMIVGSSPV